MRKLISLLVLSFLSIGILLAQNEPKYLEGAVPLIDGKVTFATEMNTGTMSKAVIYETLLKWANDRYQITDKFKARILFKDAEEGTIAIHGDEYIVFSSTALALDRTRINYQLFFFCEEGKCKINMTRIRYHYQEERDGGEKYNAEDWITDEFCLNKTKTKLYPISGKFRRKTIDLKDQLFKEIQSILGNKMIDLGLQAAPTTPESRVKVITTQPKEEVVPAMEIQPTAVKVPAAQPTVQQPEPVKDTPQPSNDEALIAQAVRMTITAGNDEQFEISKECWGGFGELFGKKVAFCLIDTQKTMGNMLMSQSDNYKISFYGANNSQPVVVIECKKLMTQNINGEEAQKMSPSCVAGKSYNMYVGEILK